MKTAKEMREDLQYIISNLERTLTYNIETWDIVHDKISSGENQVLKIMLLDALRFGVHKSPNGEFFENDDRIALIIKTYGFTEELIYKI